MTGLKRRLNGALGVLFPERRLFIQSGSGTRYLRLTPLVQLALGASALSAVGWMAVATATVVLDLVAAETQDQQAVVLHDAYQSRLEALGAERDQRAAEAHSAQNRFQIAMEQISRQQTSILHSVEQTSELTTALEIMRQRLQQTVAQRDGIAIANDQLLEQMDEVSATLGRHTEGGSDLVETLEAVTGALTETVVARDEAAADRAQLASEVAALELRVVLNSRLQDQMIEQLEQAVALSFGPMEKLLEQSSLDVETLIATVRRSHSGAGGPLSGVSVSTRSFDDPEMTSRFDSLMIDLDRMNLLRIAAGKIPYAMPVTASYRFTSGFGYRSDPKGSGRRMHKGADFAAPRGTPIFATADGVVVSAKRESGYGNTVRIRHEFGFETVYAHQHTLRVKTGQQVSRGQRIGDMGTTGRSTGVHLHYEVHLNGQPVNPMTYLEAAKDVF